LNVQKIEELEKEKTALDDDDDALCDDSKDSEKFDGCIP
jgi:uncharacterized protein (UPF0335 family)